MHMNKIVYCMHGSLILLQLASEFKMMMLKPGHGIDVVLFVGCHAENLPLSSSMNISP